MWLVPGSWMSEKEKPEHLWGLGSTVVFHFLSIFFLEFRSLGGMRERCEKEHFRWTECLGVESGYEKVKCTEETYLLGFCELEHHLRVQNRLYGGTYVLTHSRKCHTMTSLLARVLGQHTKKKKNVRRALTCLRTGHLTMTGLLTGLNPAQRFSWHVKKNL